MYILRDLYFFFSDIQFTRITIYVPYFFCLFNIPTEPKTFFLLLFPTSKIWKRGKNWISQQQRRKKWNPDLCLLCRVWLASQLLVPSSIFFFILSEKFKIQTFILFSRAGSFFLPKVCSPTASGHFSKRTDCLSASVLRMEFLLFFQQLITSFQFFFFPWTPSKIQLKKCTYVTQHSKGVVDSLLPLDHEFPINGSKRKVKSYTQRRNIQRRF